MTKKEREKQEEWGIYVQIDDIVTVQIGEARFPKSIFLGVSQDGIITFRDNAGIIIQSNEPYTLAVTEQVNEDDDEDNKSTTGDS